MQLYVGNAAEDGTSTRGWFIGRFIIPAIGGIRSTSEFESKWCVCRAGQMRSAPARPAAGTTVVILVAGQLRLIFDDREVVLSRPADYAMWNGEGSHSWIAETESTVITFRTPSGREGDSAALG
ncbi:MAG: signal peptidase I [Jatrophihabitans sp.]